MTRHRLPRHRHTWGPWEPVVRHWRVDLDEEDGGPEEWSDLVRYDDGTVLHRRACTFPQCQRTKERCLRLAPPGPTHRAS